MEVIDAVLLSSGCDADESRDSVGGAGSGCGGSAKNGGVHVRSKRPMPNGVGADTDEIGLMEKVSASGHKAASSARVLGAVQSLLDLQCQDSEEETGAADDRIQNASKLRPVGANRERLDGYGFGVPSGGVLDASVSLLTHVICARKMVSAGDRSGGAGRGGGDHGQTLVQESMAAESCQLWSQVCRQLERGGSGELSPAGLVAALRFIAGVLTCPGVDVAGLVLRKALVNGTESDDLLGMICCRVLAPVHLQAVAEWPEAQRHLRGVGSGKPGGGGIVGVAAIVLAAVKVLQAPLDVDGWRDPPLRVQQGMHNRGVVGAVLEAMRALGESKKGGGGERPNLRSCRDDGETDGEEDEDEEEEQRKEEKRAADDAIVERAVCDCVGLISRLVVLSHRFGLQLLDHGGLAYLVSIGALSDASPPALVRGALLICSQLARASVEHYAHLRAVGVDTSLRPLLAHPDPTIRAKACNVVGNLCRHATIFYTTFLQEPVETPLTVSHPSGNDGFVRAPAATAVNGARGRSRTSSGSVVDLLVKLCADPDSAVRKFACFAVGNAAFHSDELYTHLAPVVASIVTALGDPDDKTRANAAGALGNLVRNGGALSAGLARCGGVAALVGVAARDPVASPRRIALFSLGTCCAYAPCREELMLLDLRIPGQGALSQAGSEVGVRGAARDGEQSQNANAIGGGTWDLGGEKTVSPALRFTSETEAAVGGGAGQGLERWLLELERDAADDGDDVALKYVARMRNKLSGPVHA